MSNRNESSSLVALRELRNMERRRSQEEEQARAEQQRREQAQARARAEAERLARQQAEHEAALAEKAAESQRLQRDLEGARQQIDYLRREMESAKLAHAQLAALSVPPAPLRPRPFAWLGLTAGASMLVGALALVLATRPPAGHPVSLDLPARPAPSCPAPLATPEPRPAPTSQPAAVRPPALRPAPRPRPAPTARPHNGSKPPSTPVCDGTDPLCGLPLGKLDDLGKLRRKGDGQKPR
jgi:hypothetical protein